MTERLVRPATLTPSPFLPHEKHCAIASPSRNHPLTRKPKLTERASPNPASHPVGTTLTGEENLRRVEKRKVSKGVLKTKPRLDSSFRVFRLPISRGPVMMIPGTGKERDLWLSLQSARSVVRNEKEQRTKSPTRVKNGGTQIEGKIIQNSHCSEEAWDLAEYARQ